MPTLFAIPWPSGPVVVSTPEVRWYSGWPGHLLPSWRKCFRSSSATEGVPSRSYFSSTEYDAGQVQQRIEQGRGVARRQHEAVAVGPDRVGGIEAQKLLPQGVNHRRHRHRRPGMAGIGLLHRIDAQGPDGVDADLVDRARRVPSIRLLSQIAQLKTCSVAGRRRAATSSTIHSTGRSTDHDRVFVRPGGSSAATGCRAGSPA